MKDLTSTLRALAREVPQEEFLSRTSGLYLIVSQHTIGDEQELTFNTQSSSHAKLMKAAHAAQSRTIVAVEKSERSPYAAQISIGRARNCDVVLREPSVSKLHAHFIQRDGGWAVVDRDSANGTVLNGRAIRPGDPATIVPGDKLDFGGVECVVADAGVLFRELGPGVDAE